MTLSIFFQSLCQQMYTGTQSPEPGLRPDSHDVFVSPLTPALSPWSQDKDLLTPEVSRV